MEKKVIQFEIGKAFAVVLVVIAVAIFGAIVLQGSYFKGELIESERISEVSDETPWEYQFAEFIKSELQYMESEDEVAEWKYWITFLYELEEYNASNSAPKGDPDDPNAKTYEPDETVYVTSEDSDTKGDPDDPNSKLGDLAKKTKEKADKEKEKNSESKSAYEWDGWASFVYAEYESYWGTDTKE
jgi:hypothetical protein